MSRNERVAIAGGAVAVAAACIMLAVATALAANGGSTAGAKSATAKYRTLATAKGAGYGLLKDKNGVACIAMPGMPNMAMGVHYAKAALVGDGRIATNTPEALVYAPDGYGGLQLAAVEYVVLQADWAKHHTSAPSLFGHQFNFTPAGNRFGLPAYYSLHVWIYKHNPSGMFSMWNPEVHCK